MGFTVLETNYLTPGLAPGMDLSIPFSYKSNLDQIIRDLERTIVLNKMYSKFVNEVLRDLHPFTQGSWQGHLISKLILESFLGNSEIKKENFGFVYYNQDDKLFGLNISYYPNEPSLWTATIIQNANSAPEQKSVVIIAPSKILGDKITLGKIKNIDASNIQNTFADYVKSEVVMQCLGNIFNFEGEVNCSAIRDQKKHIIPQFETDLQTLLDRPQDFQPKGEEKSVTLETLDKEKLLLRQLETDLQTRLEREPLDYELKNLMELGIAKKRYEISNMELKYITQIQSGLIKKLDALFDELYIDIKQTYSQQPNSKILYRESLRIIRDIYKFKIENLTTIENVQEFALVTRDSFQEESFSTENIRLTSRLQVLELFKAAKQTLIDDDHSNYLLARLMAEELKALERQEEKRIIEMNTHADTSAKVIENFNAIPNIEDLKKQASELKNIAEIELQTIKNLIYKELELAFLKASKFLNAESINPSQTELLKCITAVIGSDIKTKIRDAESLQEVIGICKEMPSVYEFEQYLNEAHDMPSLSPQELGKVLATRRILEIENVQPKVNRYKILAVFLCSLLIIAGIAALSVTGLLPSVLFSSALLTVTVSQTIGFIGALCGITGLIQSINRYGSNKVLGLAAIVVGIGFGVLSVFSGGAIPIVAIAIASLGLLATVFSERICSIFNSLFNQNEIQELSQAFTKPDSINYLSSTLVAHGKPKTSSEGTPRIYIDENGKELPVQPANNNSIKKVVPPYQSDENEELPSESDRQNRPFGRR